MFQNAKNKFNDEIAKYQQTQEYKDYCAKLEAWKIQTGQLQTKSKNDNNNNNNSNTNNNNNNNNNDNQITKSKKKK